MVATDRVVIVLSSEYAVAYDRVTGAHLWDAYITETSGWTPAVVTPAGVLVVKLSKSFTVAVDVATGRDVAVPPGTDVPDNAPPLIADGYRSDGRRLYFGDRLIWTKARGDSIKRETTVARVGALTVINDFYEGLRVVEDDGTLLSAPRIGRREYSETPTLVSGTTAFVVTPDGTLYAIEGS